MSKGVKAEREFRGGMRCSGKAPGDCREVASVRGEWLVTHSGGGRLEQVFPCDARFG